MIAHFFTALRMPRSEVHSVISTIALVAAIGSFLIIKAVHYLDVPTTLVSFHGCENIDK